MYEKFYGLTCSPFALSPDPNFFCPMPLHNEALAILSYGVMRRKGFMVVTGEVGTGKTLLVRYLLEFFGRNNVASAMVYNPLLSVPDFLSYLLKDLRLSVTARTKGEMLSYLNDYLLFRSRRGATTAFIVDEAHLLSWELLEEIRLMTNLETSQHKLVQIILVGQLELDEKLDSPGLRQLKQRVGLRCHLKPLTPEQVTTYIHYRLRRAGEKASAPQIFPEKTIAVINDLSRGIPRIINNLCENALISGYGKQTRQITVELVREVATDLRLNTVTAVSAEGYPKTDTGMGIPPLSADGVLSDTTTEVERGLEV